MNQTKKRLIGAAAVLTFAVPAFAGAAALTNDQLRQVTDLLESFGVTTSRIDSVAAILSSSTTPQVRDVTGSNKKLPPGQLHKALCFELRRNLGRGERGDDVRKLQDMLAADPDTEFTASSTGYFGPLTARALVKFQEKHGIAIGGDGYVGPLTRAFFKRACGLGLSNGGPGSDSGNRGRGNGRGGSDDDSDDNDDSDDSSDDSDDSGDSDDDS